jgi:hypothetical protein
MIKSTISLSLSLTYEIKGFLFFRVGMGTKEDESLAGHVGAAGFHHVTACSHLVHILKLINHLFL